MITLPCAAPYLFTGIKLAVAYSLHRRHRRRVHHGSTGLGYEIAFAYNNFDNADDVCADPVRASCWSTIVNTLFYSYERRLLRAGGR